MEPDARPTLGAPTAPRRMLWVSLPDQRPRRELYWMSRMPDTRVRALARQEPLSLIHISEPTRRS